MAAEALLLSVIQKLQWRQARLSCSRFCMAISCSFTSSDRYEKVRSIIKEEKTVIDELRAIVDILKDKKFERVDYFISDLVEMARDALDLYQHEKLDTFSYEMECIQSWIGEIKKRVLEFEGDGVGMEGDGEGDDDDREEVVGMEEDVKLLLRTRIFNEETNLMVSSSSALNPLHVDHSSNRDDKKHSRWTSLITGVAGIGKTALARQVYNHVDVVDRFERRAWVCSSSELTNKEVLMKILQQIMDSGQLKRGSLLEKMEQADNESLQQMLHQHLQGLRYFIVFDDLPKQMSLKSILRGLPHEDNGSRLLLTSVHTQRKLYHTHEMEPLDFDKSWQLFTKTLFRGDESTNEGELPKQLVESGRDMLLTQCGGVPSAIKEVARQLAEKRRSGSEWEQLLQPIDFHAILEAIILPIVQKLERHPQRKQERDREVERVCGDLRMILDFVRDKKLRKGSKLYDFICDLVDMAQDLVKKMHISLTDHFKSWVDEIKTCMLEFEVDRAEMRSGNVEIEGDDGDEDVVVIGLEEDVELLLRAVIFTKKGYTSKISICLITGVAGIGKTTLARQVYNHVDVVDQFDIRAWVCVSTNLSHKKVLIKMIQQVVHCDEFERDSLLEIMERPDNFCLREMLYKYLLGMRYLIVLDDFPKGMCLDYILEALPLEDNGSRLLLTSRARDAKRFSQYTHEMEPLDSEQSWQFFMKTLFCGTKSTNEHEFSKQMVKRGKDMLLTRCNGVRLAIKEVAWQLAEKRRSGSEWEQLLQPIDFHVILEAILLPIIQKLDRCQQWNTEKVTSDLTMVLDFVRDKKLGEGSRLYHFICDLVDMAQDVQVDQKNWWFAQIEVPFESWIRVIKQGMLHFGVDGAEMRPESVEIEGDDEVEDVVAIGLEEDVKLLLRRLSFREQHPSQLSTSLITGMVGSGKTTLARQVYNSAQVVNQFECRAWVCVSTNFSHKKILMKIMQQVVRCEEFERDSLLEKMDRLENHCLREMLHKHLQGMRYFIVLDDFPKGMCLDYILGALPFEDKGSRLLLTSRTGRIEYTNSANYTEYTHRTKTLDPHNSWQLLLKTISSELRFPKYLEGKGRDMLRKCDGLPLAIVEVGKQMARRRRSGSEWEEVLESIDFGAILVLFESIYHNLDPEPKKCFLHLAFFKEHTSIRIEKFKRILATAGIVPKREIESNISILIEECIVEVEDKKSYRVNAILHRLSIKNAEEIGLEILSHGGNNQHSQSPRHRVVICSREEFNYSTDHDEHLVSLFFHRGGYFDSSPLHWKSFERRLRILDFEDFGLKSLPESIGGLRELRYLGLRNNYIQELPLSLGQLELLEVLDISLNLIAEVPDFIQGMRSLRHLYMSDVICGMPLMVEMMENLETLTYVSIDHWQVIHGLKELSRLRKLGIEELDTHTYTRSLCITAATMTILDYLILRSRFRNMPCFSELELPRLDKLELLSNIKRLKLEGLFHDLLAYQFPPNIEYLKLVNICLDEDPMPVLEKLPRLKQLKLRNAYTGRQMVISQHWFRNLEILCIEESWNLRNVRVGEGAMYNLKKLEIKNCPNLETLPEEIWWMSKLEELKIVTTKRIATKIREIALKSKIRVVEINP